MKILVINSGSSSIKYKLFEMNPVKVLASGLIEKIAEKNGHAEIKYLDTTGGQKLIKKNFLINNHKEGFEIMESLLVETGSLNDMNRLDAIGHRVVHGGEEFKEPSVIDERTICAIEKLIPLAPLHNPANLEGIKSAMEYAPDVIHVAVFDTAFHQSMQDYAYLYALPYELYKKYGIRRYGFHGTSHSYVAKRAAAFLNRSFEQINIITLHLGNGASATAIKNGKSIDTSMGMTPLEGLIMGTRSGDIDPGILFYLSRHEDLSIDELDSLLNKKSGLKGICGNNDIREIQESAEKDDYLSILALKMFINRLKKYIGSYMAVLGKVDAIVFTGGIGEHSEHTREKTCENLERMGISIDIKKNCNINSETSDISSDISKTKILVIKTDEELEISTQTEKIIKSHQSI